MKVSNFFFAVSNTWAEVHICTSTHAYFRGCLVLLMLAVLFICWNWIIAAATLLVSSLHVFVSFFFFFLGFWKRVRSLLSINYFPFAQKIESVPKWEKNEKKNKSLYGNKNMETTTTNKWNSIKLNGFKFLFGIWFYRKKLFLFLFYFMLIWSFWSHIWIDESLSMAWWDR